MATVRHRIILFVSRESATYHYVRRQVESACVSAGGDLDIVEISDRPDLAEKLNIEALPTVVIGERRFVGVPGTDFLRSCLEGLGKR
ncbi:MAG: thioredoxin family protein [Patescibacteria group bacterium]|nr:thioredoxin family protein [Patescibacteria group bacterium]